MTWSFPWFELILTVRRKLDVQLRAILVVSFGRYVIVAELWRLEVAKFASGHRSTLFCSNFVKCCRAEIGEIVRLLHDQKNKISAASQTVVLRGSRPKSARASPNNVLTVLQTSFKSVDFRRSYSRTREHRLFCLVELFPLFARIEV